MTSADLEALFGTAPATQLALSRDLTVLAACAQPGDGVPEPLAGRPAAEVLARLFGLGDTTAQRLCEAARRAFDSGVAETTTQRQGGSLWQHRVTPLTGPAGEVDWVLYSAQAMPSAGQGEQFGVLSARLEAVEQDLQQERDFLATILDTLTEAIVVADADGKLRRFNRAAQDLHGLPAEPIPQEEWPQHYDLYLADGETRMQPDDIPLLRALGGEVVRDAEMVIHPKGQAPRTLVANGQAIFSATGKKLGAAVAMHDISARKRSEERLRFLAEASHQLGSALEYEQTLDVLTHLIVPFMADWCTIDLLEPDGSLKHLSIAHQNPETQAWGRALRERYPSDPDAQHGLYQVLRSGQPEFHPDIPEAMLVAAARDEEHLAILRKVGMRSAIIMPLRLRGETLGAMTLVMSESERRYTGQDLALAEELAQRAAVAVDNARNFLAARLQSDELERRVSERTAQLQAAVEELDSFAYTVSHDLRAPLRGIDGFSEVIVEEYGERLDETGKNYLGRVRSAARRMGELIDDLLMFSRLMRSDMRAREVDLSALAEVVAARLRERDPARAVRFELSPGLRAWGDERLLGVALENLLENAWKFSRDAPQARVAFGTESQNGETVYVVRDNGAGFDMTYAHKLFATFQRLHGEQDFEGTGIGLSTVQRIIKRHGGRIWGESAPGQGAAFFFTLPDPAPPADPESPNDLAEGLS